MPSTVPSQSAFAATNHPFKLALRCIKAGLLGALAVYAFAAQAQTIVPGKIPGQFGVSPSGAATYSIPIQVPPGIAGMQPKLSLDYNSQGGNGLMGMGWSLGGLSAITRCPRTMAQDGVRGGVNHDWSDRFCLDGQRLMLVDANGVNISNQALYGGGGTQYRTEFESFNQITAYGMLGSGPAYFIVKTKAGLTMLYGNTGDSVTITATGTRTSWGLTTITDIRGNQLNITYSPDHSNGMTYPIQIDYAGNAVKFDYGPSARPDAITAYQAGSKTTLWLRLKAIESYVGSKKIATANIAYNQSPSAQQSVVSSVTICDGGTNCLTPNTFTYNNWQIASGAGNFVLATYQEQSLSGYGAGWTMLPADINGDGKSDIIAYFIGEQNSNLGIKTLAFIGDGTGNFVQTAYNDHSSSGYGAGWNISPVDINGDGKMDLLAYFGGSLNSNLGIKTIAFIGDGTGNFVQAAYNDLSSSGYGAGWNIAPVDINGDGKIDIVAYFIGDKNSNLGIKTLTYIGDGAGNFVQTAYNDHSSSGYGAGWNMAPVDINGDGNVDMLAYFVGPLNSNLGIKTIAFIGDGKGNFILKAYNDLSSSGYGAGWSIAPVDINGDGKTDIVAYFAGELNSNLGIKTLTYIGDGAGNFVLAAYKDHSSSGYGAGWAITYMDLNGDGNSDMLAYFIGPLNSNLGIRTLAFMGDGAGNFAEKAYTVHSPDGYGPGWTMAPADINGDGKIGLMVYLVGAQNANLGIRTMTFKSQQKFETQLQKIQSGASQSILISYQSLSEGLSGSTLYTKDTTAVYPQVDLQMPMQVVSRVERSNGVGGMNATDYTYGGLKAEQGTGRGMLGFRWMQSKEIATGIESRTEYSQQWPFVGTPIKSETRLAGAGNAGLLKRSTSNPACKIPGTGANCPATPANCNDSAPSSSAINQQCQQASANRYFLYTASSTEESWDLNSTAFPTLGTSYVYDITPGDSQLWGDPTSITVTNSDGSSKVTTNQYEPANVTGGNWILGRLKRASVVSTQP
jgi:hypothetical protein